MIRRLIERTGAVLRDVRWLFVPLGGAEDDERDPIYVRRNHPEITKRRGLTERQMERWQGDGTLPLVPTGGKYAPALVKLSDVDDYLVAQRIMATHGPLVDAPRRLREAIDALASRYEDDPQPGTPTHALLVEIGERIDRAIQE